MKKVNSILLLFIMLLAACGGGAETAVSPEVDVANLPDTVDVATVNALLNNDDVLLIDVREQWEYDEGHLPGITLIPMGDVPNRLSEIPTDKEVILTCRSGNRSGQVTDFLRQQGYTNVHNMEGGIVAWQAAGFPVEQ
ncbi:MAG: rhodanese-like domain-containing protein [Anaerolineales bacterium]|nr:rhodanese-like domain-containing protein [Anaerolineales bacterium]MCA9927720.1 rhodanese-like domain-containing protein [Anaerolineales bacterium]